MMRFCCRSFCLPGYIAFLLAVAAFLVNAPKHVACQDEPNSQTTSPIKQRKLVPPYEGEKDTGAMSQQASVVLENWSDEALPKIVPLLASAHAETRMKAMDRLRSKLADDPKIQKAFAKLSYDPNDSVRLRLFTIVYHEDELAASPLLKPMINGLDDADEGIREHAIGTLVRYGESSLPAVPRLIELLDNEDLQEDAAKVLGAIGPKAKAAIPKLLSNTKANHYGENVYSNALARMGQTELLLKIIADDNRRQLYGVAASLAYVEPTNEKILDAMALYPDDTEVIRALGKVRPSNERVVELLGQSLKAESVYSRQIAAEALGKLEPKLPSAIPLLKFAMKDSESDVVKKAALSLANYDLGKEEKLKMQLAIGTDSLLDFSTLYKMKEQEPDWGLVAKFAADIESDQFLRLNSLVFLELITGDEAKQTELTSIEKKLFETEGIDLETKAFCAGEISGIDAYEPDLTKVTMEMIDSMRAGLRDGKFKYIRELCAQWLGKAKAKSAIGDLLDAASTEEFYAYCYDSIGKIGDPSAIPHLIKHLREYNSETSGDFKAGFVAKALGEIGTSAQPAIPLLKNILHDEREYHSGRDEAAVAYAKIVLANDLDYEKVVKGFGHLLRNGNKQHRESAYEALQKFPGEKLNPALSAIAESMNSKDTDYPERFVGLLRTAGADAGEFAPALIKQLERVRKLEDGKYRVIEVLQALRSIKPDPDIAIPAIVAEFDRPSGQHGDAVLALEPFGKDASPAVPRLTKLLKVTPESRTRSQICKVLSGIGEEAKSAIPALIDGFHNDPDDSIKRHYERALIMIGYENKEALAALFTRYEEGEEINIFSIDDPKIANNILQSGLKSENDTVRAGALSQLSRIGNSAQYTEAYLELLQSDEEQPRLIAARALRNYSVFNQQVSDVYLSLLDSEDEEVSEEAGYALHYAEPRVVEQIVSFALDEEKPIESRRKLASILNTQNRIPLIGLQQLSSLVDHSDENLKQWIAVVVAQNPKLRRDDVLLQIVESDSENLRQALAAKLQFNDENTSEQNANYKSALTKLYADEDDNVANRAAYQLSHFDVDEKILRLCQDFLKSDDEEKQRRVFAYISPPGTAPDDLVDDLQTLARKANSYNAQNALQQIARSKNGLQILLSMACDASDSSVTRLQALQQLAKGRQYFPQSTNDEGSGKKPWLSDEDVQSLIAVLDEKDEAVAQFAAIALINNDRYKPELQERLNELLLSAVKSADQGSVQLLLNNAWHSLGANGRSLLPGLIEVAKTAELTELRQVVTAIQMIDRRDPEALKAITSAWKNLSPANARDELLYSFSGFDENLVPHLLPLIESSTQPNEREQADLVVSTIRLLGILREEAKGAVPSLQKLMQSKNPEIRLQAAVEISLIAPETDGIAIVLGEALEQESERRNQSEYQIWEALLRLESRASPILDQVVSKINGKFAHFAIEVLGSIGPAAESALPKLVAELEGANQIAAALAIIRIGNADASTISRICEMYVKAEDTYELDEPMSELGEAASPIVEQLEQQLRNPYLTSQAAYKLSALGPVAAPASNLLISLLDSPDNEIKQAAIQAIGSIASDGTPMAQEKLIGIYKSDNDSDSSHLAGLSLSKMKSKKALSIFIAELDEQKRASNACNFIGHYEEIGAEAVPKLTELLDDKKQRMNAAKALSRLGDVSKPAIPRIIEILNSVDPQNDPLPYRLLIALENFGAPASAALPKLEELAAFRRKNASQNRLVQQTIEAIREE